MNRKQRRANKNQEQEYRASVIDCSQTFVLRLELPEKTLKDVKLYSQGLIKNENAQSHGANLAGEIANGSELTVDIDDVKITELSNSVKSLAVSYIKEFQKRVPQFTRHVDISQGVYVENEEMWLNVYKKGDYNPYHDHNTKSVMGLSWFLYVDVPAGMNQDDIHEHKGNVHGCTQLQWGYDFHTYRDSIRSLVIPPNLLVKPEEGNLYLFPKWMKHQVYPHACDGDRISIAGNISIFTSKGEK